MKLNQFTNDCQQRCALGVVALCTLSMSGFAANSPHHGANELGWSAPFGGASALDAQLFAFERFDDGTGSALYAGGQFNTAGGISSPRIARWDGASWSSVGAGFNPPGWVLSLAVFDDGSGSALYVGGGGLQTIDGVSGRVLKWNGEQWTGLGEDLGGVVFSMAVFDDGNGPALYAGGSFSTAGGKSTARIARWDGAQWLEVGGGMNGTVNSLAVFDDGTGPALYAGGSFTQAGNVNAIRIARWDGTQWSEVGGGVDDTVRSLTAFDDGSGSALYVGGTFTTAGELQANRIARWDGEQWSNLVDRGVIGVGGPIWVLHVFDDGSGPALLAGGTFSTAGPMSAGRIAKWDGSQWSSLGDGLSAGIVRALAEFDGGTGSDLYVGGWFTEAGGISVGNIARWTGQAWRDISDAPNDVVIDLASIDLGNGVKLYAGGNFNQVGGKSLPWLAQWDGEEWTSVGDGPQGGVASIRALDDGSGEAIYITGSFIHVGDIQANRIARWDEATQTWSALGSGLSQQTNISEVFDDGSGPALYAGGFFGQTGDGETVNRVAKWDGKQWLPLGTGLSGGFGFSGVWALAALDDGSGPALYAGGNFTTAGSVQVNRIARWDGKQWSALGAGFNDGWVRSIVVFDDGSGPALYAGGWFATSGSQQVNHVARFDGSAWTSVGGGTDGQVDRLFVVHAEDRTLGGTKLQPGLYAAGRFTTAGGVISPRIARWDGHAWHPIGSGITGDSGALWPPSVYALTMHDDGTGPALYAGGIFTAAGCAPAGNIARWSSSGEPGVIGDLNLDCIVDGADLLILLSAWGECDDPEDCPADLNGDGVVDGADLLILLSNWG